MTIKQVKEEARKRFGQELTDKEAQALPDQHGGELSDEALGDVSGGRSNIKLIQPAPFQRRLKELGAPSVKRTD